MKIVVLGAWGFIGKTLVPVLEKAGHEVWYDLRTDADRVVHLGAPSSHEQFKWDMDGAFSNTINTFLRVVSFCKTNGIDLVYASSVTAEKKFTPYGKAKAICEDISAAYEWGMGVRIACGYGPNESHKGEYASVLYKFCNEMKEGRSPVIWGDGTQTRDFVYQDDIADTFLRILTTEPRMDCHVYTLRTGVETSFNDLVRHINVTLGSDIQPTYVNKPLTYVDSTTTGATNSLKDPMSIHDGIREVLGSL